MYCRSNHQPPWGCLWRFIYPKQNPTSPQFVQLFPLLVVFAVGRKWLFKQTLGDKKWRVKALCIDLPVNHQNWGTTPLQKQQNSEYTTKVGWCQSFFMCVVGGPSDHASYCHTVCILASVICTAGQTVWLYEQWTQRLWVPKFGQRHLHRLVIYVFAASLQLKQIDILGVSAEATANRGILGGPSTRQCLRKYAWVASRAHAQSFSYCIPSSIDHIN